MTAEKKITVAICTFRRQAGLERLLLKLEDQVGIDPGNVQVVVVDNDPQATARDVVEQILSRNYVYKLDYFVEAHPGVAHARNRCLAESRGDFIAFIDDDEVPVQTWLVDLVNTQTVTQADVVCGPVLPRFELPPPDWILKGRFFERNRFPDKTRIEWGGSRTGNVLFRREVIDLAGGKFDERFSTSGAEDALFFFRAERMGSSIFWSDSACVYEYIPASRMNLKWLTRRAYKGGQNWTRILAESSRYIWLQMMAKGLVSAIVSMALLVPAFIVSRVIAIRLTIRIAGDIGKLTALWASARAQKSYGHKHYAG